MTEKNFLEDVTLDSDREAEDENKATSCTHHHAPVQGLEFPNVYVVGLEDGLALTLESRRQWTRRRLFYVTRAMLTLISQERARMTGHALPSLVS
jgi:superfamily I DNA/RNA helicase